jgi:hypothetical protein
METRGFCDLDGGADDLSQFPGNSQKNMFLSCSQIREAQSSGELRNHNVPTETGNSQGGSSFRM